MATAVKGTPSTAVATLDRKGISALLTTDEAKQRITPMLRGVEYERIVGEVYLAAGDNAEILECTPASIVRAVARAVSWGLVIGETVHLIPFNVNVAKRGEDDRWEKRLKAIQDYKGKTELIVAAGGARSIDAQVVYAKEPFEHEEGTSPFIKHKPARTAAERGEMIGAYAVAHHGFNRQPTIVYMPLADIDAIRTKLSKQWKSGACPPWYARKTCVHQLAKLLPKSARLLQALAMLDEDEDIVELQGAPVATVSPASGVKRVESGETLLDDRWVEQGEEREPGIEG